MKVYFIGIGGIGISALAQYYLAQGHEVFGSDLINSEITQVSSKYFTGQFPWENHYFVKDLSQLLPVVNF